MLTRREFAAAGCGALIGATFVAPTAAAEQATAGAKLKVVASFSILADLVRNVGGARLELATLVGPNGNAHVYAPSPADAKKVSDARLVLVNGLGFEGWLDRLVKASGTKAPIVVAAKGVTPLERAGARDHDHGGADPHAWQSVANATIYVGNIRAARIPADPAASTDYQSRSTPDLTRLRAPGRQRRFTPRSIPQD